MNRTPIEWTDFSSNPIIYRNAEGHVVWACVKVDDNCTNCYAETLAKRYGRGGPFNAGEMAKLTPELNLPEVWKLLSAKRVGGKDVSGSRIFIEDMSDLFGGWVPDVLLDRLMAVFALRRDVIYQLLTKRPDRARRYFDVVGSDTDEWRDRWDAARRWLRAFLLEHGEPASMGRPEYVGMVMANQTWPLKHVRLGTSAGNQKAADLRIPELLRTKAVGLWVSYEPALGPVDFTPWLSVCPCGGTQWVNDENWSPEYPGERRVLGAGKIPCGFCNEGGWGELERARMSRLDWIVVGGESGPGARPFDVAWARQTVRQGKAAGVPVFVKQLGAVPCEGEEYPRDYPIFMWPSAPIKRVVDGVVYRTLKSSKGGDMSEWPEDLRVRELPEVRA